MSDLFNDEAAEDSASNESREHDGADDEQIGADAERSGDDVGEAANEEEQDSSEEEEDDDNEYDLTDKFIAREDEDDEDGEGGSEEEREAKRRHKRRREKSLELEEEDYQLLEDNQVTGIRRKSQATRKRIRKQHDNLNKTDAERLQEELFGTTQGGTLDEEEADEAPSYQDIEEDFAESEDEMAGFIADDDDDTGRRAGRSRSRKSTQGMSSHGIQEMQEIFGDVDDLLEMYAEKKAASVMKDVDDLEPPPEDEEDIDVEDEELKEQRRQQRKQRQIEAAIEPELMERLMIQPQDDRIRQRDAPERFQLSGEADLKDAFNERQLEDAARWILEQLVPSMGIDLAGILQSDEGSSGATSRAGEILEGGILEVDGKPRDRQPRREAGLWERDELEEGVTDLSRGLRGLKRERTEQERSEWRRDAQYQKAATEAITKVLKEMWNNQHEIPVIASFRKQICGELLSMDIDDRPGVTSDREARRRRDAGQPYFPAGAVQAKHRSLRRWGVLWAVQDLASTWRGLVRRREKRLDVFKAALSRCETLRLQQEEEPDRLVEDMHSALRSCITDATEANSMEALDDVDAKFKLVMSGHVLDVAEEGTPGTRRPQRSSAYTALKKAGLDGLVSAMAMSAVDFGDNLQRFLKRNQPQDPRIMPTDMAYDFVKYEDPAFDAPEKVLERARQIHVLEIINEPQVRSFFRRQIDKHMSISTAPTPTGESQLDAFHVYGRVKRLKQMPVAAFAGKDTYLRIHLAEQEGLITVVNEVADLEQNFVQPMLEYYESSAVSAVSKEWNNLRHVILREAVQRLVPQLQQEANGRLLSRAREVVIEEYAENFWKFASLPPVQLKTEDGDVVERRRLAACCWGEGRPATCVVMLDDQGALVDVLYLPSFSGKVRAPRPGADYNIAQDPRKASDVARIVEFCRENRPQAIFVGAKNQYCKPLKEDISRIGDHILDAHAQILTSGHDTGTIEVSYAEETIAELWASCEAAKEEFPDHPDVVRRAVALGRLALEPLAVLAAVCGQDGKEILSLKLHPLQAQVPEAELMRASEVALMTAVAQVGADVNLMASNGWLAAMLPLVPGLGPRKAKSLLQAVQAQEFALNRISLWNDIWKPGNAVFRNCGGFLRITAKARGLVNAEVEPIDSARIEPLSYKMAFAVARAALGLDAQSPEDDLVAVNKALSQPEKVEALDLEELHDRLAAESENSAEYNQISTLVDIAMEFIMPNMELRHGNMLDIAESKETQFWWMFGETPASLKPGRRVEAEVRYVGQNEARCSLPEIGDLEATLSAGDISSTGTVNPADYLKVGQTVPARIKMVIPEEFRVELTTSSADLNDDARWEEKYCQAGNRYFHVLSMEERRAIEAEKRRQARTKLLTKRTIDHPNFKNVGTSEVVKLLETLPDGEAIFRPSTKSINMITLTIKLYSGSADDIIMHKDVKEGRKKGGQLTLGTPLTLLTDGNKTEEKFEDLDEVLARFVEPMVERVQQVVKHRKFREGTWEEIKLALQSDTSAPRNAANYCLGIDYLHAGFFYIGCVLPTANRTPRREYFSISASGFYFRHKMHSDLERMLAAFKRHPMGPDRQPPAHPVNIGPPPLQAPAMHPQQAAYAPLPAAYPPAPATFAYEPNPYSAAAMYQQPQQAGYRR